MNKKIQNKDLLGLTLASDAIEDYLASRLLLSNGSILPAIQLATTSIEKIFKSFINIISNNIFEKKVHDPHQLYLIGKGAFEYHKLEFNIDFLIWLEKVYHSRYSSNLFPGKEITFGEKHFLINLDDVFYKIFTFYKKCNDELSLLYFNDLNLSVIRLNNHIYSGIKSNTAHYEQKIYSFFFIDGRRTDCKTQIKSFNPKNPFVFKDAIIKNGNLLLDIDVGTLSAMDLPPSFYLK